jgi:hypothetical protein
MGIKMSRAIATAAAAAIALSTFSLQPAAAGNGHYRNNGDAAAAAAMITIFGTMVALAASNQHRDHYYGGPVYSGPSRGHWRSQHRNYRHHR